MKVRALVHRAGAPVLRWRNPRLALDLHRARQRESWSADRLRRYQVERLRRLLIHARDTVPFHRERFQRAGFDPASLRSPEDLARLPVLEKEELKAALAAGTATSTAFAPAELVTGSTTGSTGVPLRFVEDRGCLLRRRALLDRGERWTGILPGRRLTRVWRKYEHHSASERRRMRAGLLQWIPVVEVTDPTGSALGEGGLDAILDRIAGFDPEVIRGYVSALTSIARHAERRGDDRIRPGRVVGSAEYLSPSDRALLERVFRCKVHNVYGASEAPMVAVDRADGPDLHVFTDYYVTEVEAHAPGSPGRLLLTDLTNLGMPLIRYAIGDLAEESPHHWPAGSPFPRLRAVHGRVNDVFLLPGGRRVYSHVWHIYFRDLTWIDRFEVVQETPDRIAITLVTGGRDADVDALARVRGRVEEAFPGIDFSWRVSDRAGVGPGEKHRAVRSLVAGREAA